VAFFYQPPSKYSDYIQWIELHSYGVLVEELQTLVTMNAQEKHWGELMKVCQDQSQTFDGLLAQFQLVDNQFSPKAFNYLPINDSMYIQTNFKTVHHDVNIDMQIEAD
jgi:hypothetical protein